MRRTLPLLLAAAAVAAVPTSASARGFSYGVAAGEVTAKSALLWARADKAGSYTLQVSTDRRFRRFVDERVVKATKNHDNTLQRTIKGLKPDTTYYYRFVNGSKRSSVGKFRTAPDASKAKTIKFAFSGDADAEPGVGSTKPFYNNFQAYRSMARAGNLFNVNLGDVIYSDSEVPGKGALATTVKQKWEKYRQNLALRNLQLFRGAAGSYSHWDDHEFANDFTKAENGSAVYKAGVRAFRDYMPVTYSTNRGIYRTFRWGKNVELFFLDERSFRSAKASANHACDNPQTGGPDLAPTGPPATRALFAVAVPSLAAPVSQQCLDTINDPKRTMLGSKQLAAFEKAVKASSAKWKLIMNEVPIQQYYALPYDRWEGYAAERTKLLQFLSANVKNVAFLSTDVHANMVNDARFQTLEAGGPKDSGIMDFASGPVATMTYVKEIDRTTGREGNGKLITDAFFKPPPPNGVGMKCAQTNVFSYAQVTVNSKQLKVAYRDQDGKALPDCGQFTVKAK
ncbi:MAG TPA: alkaline phosphatase D family protein [Thermoleophilaceae bacterium]